MGAFAEDRKKRVVLPQAPSGATAAPSDGFSLGETLGNIPGGLRDIAEGLSGLLSTIGNDVYGGARTAVGQDADFLLDDLMKSMIYDFEGQTPEGIALDALRYASNPLSNPRVGRSIKDDYSKRYGSLLPGGRPAGETAEALEDDPLSFLLDLVDVATIGGSALATGATKLSRVPRVASQLEQMGRLGDAANVSRTARAVDKIIPGRKQQLLGEDVPLGGTMKSVSQITGRVHEYDLPTNPLRRTLRDAPIERRRTEPIENLERRIRALDELIATAKDGDPLTEWKAQRAQFARVRESARQQGISTVRTLGASRRQVDSLAKRIVNEHGSKFITNRDKLIGEHREILAKAPESALPDLHLRLQGIVETPSWGRASYEEVDGFAFEAIPEDAPRLRGIQERIRPQVERVRKMEQTYADPETLRLSDLGRRVTDDYLGRLKEEGRFADLPAFTRRLDALTPDEKAALDQDLSLAAHNELDSARRIVEIAGGEPLATLRAGVQDDLADVIDDTRLLNIDREADVLIESGKTYTELLERLYKPLRVKTYIEEGLDSIDAAPTAKELDDLRRDSNIKAPAYYPQTDTLSARRSDYLMKQSTHGMGKRSTPRSFRQNTGKTFERYLKGIKDAYDTDPNEAYARMAAEVVGMEETVRLIDDLKREVGVPISAVDEIPPGWVRINPDAVKLLLRKDRDVKLDAARLATGGADDGQALLQAVKKHFDDPTQQADDLKSLLGTRKEVFAIPEVAAQRLGEAVGYALPPKLEKALRFSWDPAMKMWRDVTLYLRGGFYINNAVGNATFLNLQGGKLRNVAQQMDGRYRKTLKKVIDDLGATGDVETGIFSPALMRSTSLEPYRGTKAGDAAIKASSSKAMDVAKAPIKWGQRLNDINESFFRRESFMTAAEKDMVRRGTRLVGSKLMRSQRRLEQILKHGADNPQAVKRWIDDMNDTMNNYSAQGPLVRKVVKRFFAPFWPFMRHAGKKLLTLPIDHPLKSTLLNQMHELNEEYVNETFSGLLPDWLETAKPVGMGDQPGETRFINPRSANPFQGITDVVENPTGLLGPLLTLLMETGTGRDSFTGKKFTSPDASTPFGSEQAYDEEGNPTDVTPLLESPVHTLLDLFPLYGTIQNMLPGGGARYSTGEVIEDEMGQPRYPSDPLYELARLAGVPLTDFNIQAWQAEELARRQQAQTALGG